jgi:hypothetical protein
MSKKTTIRAQFLLTVDDGTGRQLGEPILNMEVFSQMGQNEVDDEDALRAGVQTSTAVLAQGVLEAVYDGLTEDEWRALQDRLLDIVEEPQASGRPKCVACGGTGVSSKGGLCVPCRGTGGKLR